MPPRARPRRPLRAVGRPRADGRPRERAPAEEILFQAARLFAKQGIAATSTRQIAAAAGLRQPSLFHWYETKDAIVDALLESSIAASLDHAERVVRERQPAALRLYRMLRYDARQLCAAPYDVTAVVLSSETWGPRFARFWRRRARLIEIAAALVAAGVREGDFAAEVEPALATRIVFGMDEGVLTWFDRGGRWSAETVGDALATLALRALLRDPRRLAPLQRQAQRLAGEDGPGPRRSRSTAR